MRTLGISLALVAGFFVLLAAVAWWRQERIVFQPPGPPYPDAGGAERVTLVTADGLELFALVLRGRPDAGTLIVFHGNADLAAWQIDWAREILRRTGESVLLAEYRGYGGNPGVPTYEGSLHDARAALEFARDSLGATPERLAYFGHSLGSAVAAALASDAPPGVLILQSPLTSARDMARVMVGRPLAWTWRAFMRVHYDTREVVRNLPSPVWVVHGERDFIIPARMGRAVHRAARVPGELWLVPGAGHNDIAVTAGEEYWRWLERALADRRAPLSPSGG